MIKFNDTFDPAKMKAQRKSLSLALCFLFIGMGLVPFFAPPALPKPDSATYIVVLSEDEGTDFNKGFFRSTLQGEEESVRADSFMAVISLEGFHDNNCLVQLSKTEKQFNSRSQKSSLYLLNSCFTI
jgi:hypothetical protein